MFIKSITLCGYKRLLPADIKYLHIDFKQTHQLLLGLNGSGKSSTLQELNPLPATPQEYLKGGYKIITIGHNGQSYKLSSFIDTHPRHSFLINDLELNEGGTASVQKQLVLEHFNLDSELIEVLTDQTRFHLFSPLERRNWLTRLSGTNMDFALGFFKFVKDRLRDTEAIIKYTNARLAKESGDIMTEEHLQELIQEASRLDEIIIEMINNKSSTNNNPQIALEELRRLSDEALELTQRLTSLKFTNKHSNLTNISDLQNLISELRDKISTKSAIKQKLYQEYGEIKDALDTHASIENEDINVLLTKKQEYTNQIQTLLSDIKVYPDITNAAQIYGATLGIKNTLLNKIGELTDNSDGKFNRDLIASANDKLIELNNNISIIGNKIQSLQVAKQRFTSVEEVDCPSCNHVFKPGVDPLMVYGVEEKIKEGELKQNELIEQKTKYEDYLAKARSYNLEYQALLNLMRDSQSLEPLWENLRLVNLTTTHPSKLISLFYEWETEISKHLTVSKLTLELASIEGTIEKLNAVQNNEISIAKQRISKLSQEITQVISQINDLNHELEFCIEQERRHDEIHTGYIKLQELLAKRQEYKQKYMADFSQALLLKWMTELNVQKANIDEQINAAKQIHDVIAQLEYERDQHIATKDILKLLVQELNPTDGLIAKQSKLFIEQFVEQLNKVINAVWTYDMKILPSPIESDKLTYKFPLYFSSTEASTSDIAKSSAAQKGIVDFAFKLVVMAYLGLTDYPLYIDELAPSLDEKHRSNIMDFVKNFVESRQCSQLFLISHYHTGHGVFSNAEITILDDTNLLTKPDSFNKHVIISNKMRAYKEEH